MNIHLKLDKELLVEQKAKLVDLLSEHVDTTDSIWGIVEMIDHIQDYWEEG